MKKCGLPKRKTLKSKNIQKSYSHNFLWLSYNPLTVKYNVFTVEKSHKKAKKFRRFYNNFFIQFSRKAELLQLFSPCLIARRDVSYAARASSSTCCGVL